MKTMDNTYIIRIRSKKGEVLEESQLVQTSSGLKTLEGRTIQSREYRGINTPEIVRSAIAKNINENNHLETYEEASVELVDSYKNNTSTKMPWSYAA